MNRSQHPFAIDEQRSGRIAKRRNLLRRAVAHGWFSATSVCVFAGDLRSEWKIRAGAASLHAGSRVRLSAVTERGIETADVLVP